MSYVPLPLTLLISCGFNSKAKCKDHMMQSYRLNDAPNYVRVLLEFN